MVMNQKRRIMLTVAYDGTAYSGFAVQENTPETIEGKLNEAIERLTGEKTEVIGASRTDAGVHAYGNVVVFDTESTIPGDRFIFAINHELPQDIRITDSREVSPDFHPRHCNTEKTYEYRILNTPISVPTKRLYACHFSMPLDVDIMNEAAAYLVGEHDFTSFCNAQSQALSHVRTVKDVHVTRNGDEVVISVTGNGFLYNMVRIIAGTLMQIGRGKGGPSQMKTILEKKNRAAAGPTAPPQGLFLMKYEFLEGIPMP